MSGSQLTNLSKSINVNFDNFGDLLTEVVKYIYALAGLVLLLYLIFGGYKILLSGGDPKTLQSGKQTVTNAIIGFIVVFTSFWIVQAVGIVLGVNIIGQMF